MTRIVQLPAMTLEAQRRASDPKASIWVAANAGAGKTHVLAQRVLRLLLLGVAPESILCLTYTKAAAAEMRRRVSQWLGGWALAEDGKLDAALVELGEHPTAELRRRARTLFAHALETPGGLKISTIHAFCESVLHRFPIEAGVPIDFSVIEEDERATMVLRARERVLAGGLRGEGVVEAVATLFRLMTDYAIVLVIDAAFAEARKLRPVLADRAGAKQGLRELVRYAGRSSADVEAEILKGRLVGQAEIAGILAACPPQSAKSFEGQLLRLDAERPALMQWLEAFLKEDQTVRKNFPIKALWTAVPHLAELAKREAERLAVLCAERGKALLVERSEALVDVLGAISDSYEAQKRARSLLDFDDLIEKLGDLFADREQGPWVQYKLDAGITHILVDESQDTNPDQWQVVRSIASEFFVGDSAVERPRTLFAVGDPKQSIYSFQGAEPAIFAEEGHDVARRAKQVQRRFARVPLNTSFRSLPEVLAAVDLVCARADVSAALLAEEPIVHDTARIGTGGLVTLWPPVQQLDNSESDGEWPLTAAPRERSAPRQVAEHIAATIKGWIDQRRPLVARGRPVGADDVLILVQSRGPIFFELIRALNAARLPTPGADRLDVIGHIGIRDLLVLADVLLNPSDDLGLAALLRSPLFAFSEEELFALAHNRSGTLRRALAQSSLPNAQAAAEELRRWQRRAETDRPFEFFTRVLYADGGLKRFHARMGAEFDDAIGQFLELALAHEQTSQPSLQGFVVATRKRALSVKRELAETGTGVRVMTVHGAKGLEAPIVILADAASKPQGSVLAKPLHLLVERPGPLLIHAPKGSDHVAETLRVSEAHKANQLAEYWRKLYVAMTRAEDELYVTGALTPGRDALTQTSGTWYEVLRETLEPHSESVPGADGADPTLIYPRERALPEAIVGIVGEDRRDLGPLVLPPLTPLAARSYVQPSTAGMRPAPVPLRTTVEAAVDAEEARQEGLALHALLQHLGDVPEADRPAVIARALTVLLPQTPERHGALGEKALSILSALPLALLFGPNSRAEVPFLVNGRDRGTPILIAGRIDRLIVEASRVVIVDYKSDADPPQRPEDVPLAYRTQLGMYALVAGQLFPASSVETAILWTGLESLMFLPLPWVLEAAAGYTLE